MTLQKLVKLQRVKICKTTLESEAKNDVAKTREITTYQNL